MAEIAIVSARKSKLKRRAGDGDKNARRALELSANPNRFLATTQIGITLIGIITGAYGEASISNHIASWLGLLGWFDPYTRQVSSVLVVVGITFFSLIIGEIVPKRIGLAYPETIALLASRPMNKLSRMSSPLVHILSATTDWILRLMRLKTGGEAIVEEEEIRHMIKEGAQHGVLDRAERDMLERTFQLADKKVSSIMTVRKEIVWLQDDASEQTIKRLIKKHMHTHFPVCDGTLDSVIGVVRTDESLFGALQRGKIDLIEHLRPALFIPESMDALRALEEFKRTGQRIALVVDEYGSVQGLATVTDIVAHIVGEIPKNGHKEQTDIIQRDDHSWLVDGMTSIDSFKEAFRMKSVPGEAKGEFHTVAGLIMYLSKKIPQEADVVEWGKYHAEVVDMDQNRIDKVLLTTTDRKKKLLESVRGGKKKKPAQK